MVVVSMSLLHSLSDFIEGTIPRESTPVYWYQGQCPQSGQWLKLPRTQFSEAIARALMTQLSQDQRYGHEGKMYGILLVKDQGDRYGVLKAFSGLLQGDAWIEGWVPPIIDREQIAVQEAYTLAQLNRIQAELQRLATLPEREQYKDLNHHYAQQWQQLTDLHRQRKQSRQHQRSQLVAQSDSQTATIFTELDDQSRWDGIERRRFKQQREQVLQPLRDQLSQADAQIRHLKQQRKDLSRQLQQQLHAAYRMTNFAGDSRSLASLWPTETLPSGTGDCCAPKLLHYAATHQLIPLAMAEFWWGNPSTDGEKRSGQFYGACAERCQPIMGFLLSGENPRSPQSYEPLPILYQDETLIAVDKPAGLLSVPGRYGDRQDCVLYRLQVQLSEENHLYLVHRLDKATSGILLFARTVESQRHINQQFQQRQVTKIYAAILAGTVATSQGLIDLPVRSNPCDRPKQCVDWRTGKPSQTYFQVLAVQQNQTWVQFYPLTGRTHQLRVHAADPQGLGTPILGDRLYGHPDSANCDRLYLHAKSLALHHPTTGKLLTLQSPIPFEI